jgi:hypothetical protein
MANLEVQKRINLIVELTELVFNLTLPVVDFLHSLIQPRRYCSLRVFRVLRRFFKRSCRFIPQTLD